MTCSHKVLGGKVYADLTNKDIEAERSSDLLELSHLEVAEMACGGSGALGSYPGPSCCLHARASPLWGPVLVTPAPLLSQPMQNATKYGNSTLDHVMHQLLVSGTRPGALPAHTGPWQGHGLRPAPCLAHSRHSVWAHQTREGTRGPLNLVCIPVLPLSHLF